MSESASEPSSGQGELAGRVNELTGKRVLVVGDLMLDAYLFGDAERISPEAPVPVVRIETERHLLGGAGNVARNIAALGGAVSLVGVVGEDNEGDRLERLLENEGIASRVVRLPDRPTTIKTRVMARRQQMLRLDREHTAPLDSTALDAVFRRLDEVLEQHAVVILSDYSKGLVSPLFMERLRHRLRGLEGVRLLVDPKPANAALYGGAFLLTPNTKETGECAGLPVRDRGEILAAGRRLLHRTGCEHLLTTLGADGMALFLRDEEVWHIPTTARDVFDVTGAGDTVIAALALALAAGWPLLDASILANYAAGLVVARVGAATVTQQELTHAIRSLPSPALTRWRWEGDSF